MATFLTTAPAKLVSGRVQRTAGDLTTTSTPLVDVTGATVTLTTGANPVLAGAVQGTTNSVATNVNFFNIDIDGTLQLGAQGAPVVAPTAGGEGFNASFTLRTAALTAASHTVKEQWSVGAGTGTLFAGAGKAQTWWVEEVT